jgi:hypothetical protein
MVRSTALWGVWLSFSVEPSHDRGSREQSRFERGGEDV